MNLNLSAIYLRRYAFPPKRKRGKLKYRDSSYVARINNKHARNLTSIIQISPPLLGVGTVGREKLGEHPRIKPLPCGRFPPRLPPNPSLGVSRGVASKVSRKEPRKTNKYVSLSKRANEVTQDLFAYFTIFRRQKHRVHVLCEYTRGASLFLPHQILIYIRTRIYTHTTTGVCISVRLFMCTYCTRISYCSIYSASNNFVLLRMFAKKYS